MGKECALIHHFFFSQTQQSSSGENSAISNEILKLPGGGQLEAERPVKLFDMRKFQQVRRMLLISKHTHLDFPYNFAEREPRAEARVPWPPPAGVPVHLGRGLRQERVRAAGLALLDHAHQRRRHGHAQVQDAPGQVVRVPAALALRHRHPQPASDPHPGRGPVLHRRERVQRVQRKREQVPKYYYLFVTFEIERWGKKRKLFSKLTVGGKFFSPNSQFFLFLNLSVVKNTFLFRNWVLEGKMCGC